ncbi:MBOAT family protein [Sedimentibacter sp. zth1]|uniref:MBOAT family O-acyltransferase n=1 Tax=Sedimentibacter sp. zth1 TaxID=2816908 RepID=UPI001A923F92|nr:MBOAT family protein [Sedimentibacter sp. zth1]QSX07079.1 MBOAT family protein [Sedimentibacter sp. zth1]
MVFSSIVFLFRFLPIVLLIYYLIPNKCKNLSLLFFSLLFYSWGEPKYFFIMIASICVDYTLSLIIDNNRDKKLLCKVALLLSIMFNLGMLLFFKYYDFFIVNINKVFGLNISLLRLILPLGISFYTFQTMSYTIDVYRGKVKAERNIINFGTFVTMFPQLIAGPIVKYTDINVELKERKINYSQIQDGAETFILGLGRKVLIANNVGMLWDEVQTLGFSNISTPLAWLGVLAFTFQIYFDFSGYSLMAIGLGKMLGFNFPQNFNYPYISRSATEFWRRWHMTLGSWFREYVYIPLGGNRVGPFRKYFNIVLIWFLTGFWHGANFNFMLWGLMFAVLLIVEKRGFNKFLDKYRVFSHIYLILMVMLSWVLFSLTDLGQVAQLYKKMFIFTGGLDFIYYIRNYFVILVIAGILSTPVLKNIFNKVSKDANWIRISVTAIILILSVAYLVDATYNPFLYFRF